MAVCVLDASVAVRWLVPEIGTAEALQLLGSDRSWLAPRLLLVEVGSALRRKVVGAELTQADGMDAVAALNASIDNGLIRLAKDELLVAHALTLALRVGHKLPDCIYLALAEHEGAELATADRRLAALAQTRGVPVALVPSA
jgi:predicted nucleic acid-binding protein